MAIYSPIPLSREQDLDCFTSHAISPHLMGARFLPCPPIMQPTPLPSPPHIYFDKNYFDKFDLATHFFPEEPILKAPDLSDPLAAFLDKMNYKPHEIVLSNSTDLEQEISVQVSGYYLDSFQCSRFFKIRLLPGESKKFHEIADKDCMKFRIDFNNIAIKKINILNTTSSININEDSLTRAHCDLVIENFKKPLMPLPAYFKNGLEIPGLDVKFEEFLSADETPIHLKNFALKARNTYNQFIQGCNKFTPPSFSFLKLPIMTPDGFINYFTLPIQTLPPAIPKIVSFIWMGSP